MATPNFIPELWSQELVEQLKENLIFGGRPKRSKAAQMLRDAALGHPEYPDEDLQRQQMQEQRTATEIRMRNEMYQHQLDAMAYSAAPRMFIGRRNGEQS
jgi:hypothetical protein